MTDVEPQPGQDTQYQCPLPSLSTRRGCRRGHVGLHGIPALPAVLRGVRLGAIDACHQPVANDHRNDGYARYGCARQHRGAGGRPREPTAVRAAVGHGDVLRRRRHIEPNLDSERRPKMASPWRRSVSTHPSCSVRPAAARHRLGTTRSRPSTRRCPSNYPMCRQAITRPRLLSRRRTWRSPQH